MERLLEMAGQAADSAEVYALEEAGDSVSFENGRLKEIESQSQAGMSLRIIRDGHLGFAYTKNLIDRKGFLQNALDSLKGGVEAGFEFPCTRHVPSLDTYDPSIENLANGAIVEECQRVCEVLTPRTRGQINVSAVRRTGRVRILNSKGTDVSTASSVYALHASILFPNSYASIHRPWVHKGFKRVPDAHLQFILETYEASLKEIQIQGGRMKVLFLPEALYALLWRVQSVTNGRNIYQKVSPVMDRLNEKIFDERLTLYDDPLNDPFRGQGGLTTKEPPAGCSRSLKRAS